MGQAKGTIYMSARIFTEQKFGPESVDRCLAEMPELDRTELSSVLAVGWYPLEPMVRFHRVVDKLYGTGDLTLCYDIGKFGAEWQLNSFHKLIIRFKTPHWMLSRASRMWGHYHDSGRWEVSDTPQKIIGRLHEFSVADEAFCRREQGWFARAIELTGGAHVRVEEPNCRGRGDSYCEYVGTWN